MNDVLPSFVSDELKELMRPQQEEKKQTAKPVVVNFIEQGADFWAKKSRNYATSFEKGEMISNYNTVSPYNHLSFLLGLYRAIEEFVRDELLKREIDFTDVKEVLKMVESSFKLLSSNLETKLKSNVQAGKEGNNNQIDINFLFSTLHGFISSYIQKHVEA